jgi:hypothetical protein
MKRFYCNGKKGYCDRGNKKGINQWKSEVTEE